MQLSTIYGSDKVGRVLRVLAVFYGGQQVDDQQAGQGIELAPAVPVVWDGFQVGHQVIH